MQPALVPQEADSFPADDDWLESDEAWEQARLLCSKRVATTVDTSVDSSVDTSGVLSVDTSFVSSVEHSFDLVAESEEAVGSGEGGAAGPATEVLGCDICARAFILDCTFLLSWQQQPQQSTVVSGEDAASGGPVSRRSKRSRTSRSNTR